MKLDRSSILKISFFLAVFAFSNTHILAQVEPQDSSESAENVVIVADSSAVDSTLKDISEAFEPKPSRKQKRLAKRLADTANGHIHSPRRAVFLSLMLPGAGQVYNHSIWKVPIVYGALGTGVYAAIFNHDQHKIYLDAFYSQIDDDLLNDQFVGVYNQAQLIDLQNFFRKRRDLSIILTAVGYGLQILDAYVDAHFFYYDIDENLSLRWEPRIIRQPFADFPMSTGVGVTFSF